MMPRSTIAPNPTSNLGFDAQTHSYFIDGAPVPSVTQLLKAAGKINGQHYTQGSRDRGTDVHRLTQRHDAGELVFPPSNYLRSYRLACDVMSATWELIERPLASPTLGFAGTIDRVGLVFGARAIVEIKTGACEDWHRLQTALYALLFDEPAIDRYALYLKPTGTQAKLVQHDDSADLDEALEIVRKHA